MPKEAWHVGEEYTWREYEERPLAAGQVRIRSQFSAAKHGTELAFLHRGHGAERGRYDRDWQVFLKTPPAPPPAPRPGEKPRPAGGGIGNMTVGAVAEVGPEVKSLALGDRVLIHGGFRQTHVRGEAGCWKIPPELSWKSAVCLDPADFALGAVRDGNVRVGDAVAVFGQGAIGLMVVQLVRLSGASPVIAVEPVKSRRELALRLGADLALDPYACDAGLEIRKATSRRGADVVIDYSGDIKAMQDALRAVAYGGTVVAGSFPAPYPAGLDFGAESHLNIPRIVFSRACSEPNRDHPRWDERRIFDVCLRLLADGAISGEQVVTPVVEFEDILTEYPKIATDLENYIKIGATY